MDPFNTAHVVLPKLRTVRLHMPKGSRVLGVRMVHNDLAGTLYGTQPDAIQVGPYIPWDCDDQPVMYFMYREGQTEYEYRAFHIVPNGTLSDRVPLMHVDNFQVFPDGMLLTFHVFEIPDNQKAPNEHSTGPTS